MRMRQKFCGKRYYVYAKRDNKKLWSDWSQSNELDRAMWHIENIRSCGFLAKLVDKETNEVLIIDREKDIS